MDDEPEVDNERDQFLLFGSRNVDDLKEFGAEIELPLGKEKKKFVINEPTYVYIPKGTWHGPVKFKTIRKPVALMSYFLSPEYSTKWDEPDYSKYVGNLNRSKPMITPREGVAPPQVRQGGYEGTPPLRYIREVAIGQAYYLWPSQFGWPAQVSPAMFIIKNRWYFYMECVHAHRASHQICMYLGSNPLDIEDFDAKIEIFMGKEREEHVIDTCAVDHYVPGIPHETDEVRRVGKPIIRFMWVIGPDMQDYFKAAPKDKVLLSDESKGEVMIAEGAADYVPPTKMEDWVWPYPKTKSK